ncbi:YbhB/YbcL family Raf kinase inhibitor-like protein [Gilvimarinus sp. SDUM040013]|uniref:YbhB/YbcL family Raf kinase inhibitor-like protein n=1 Tax=Gilvimarinus gilvus TaxID=3058038 RepID=A0ABU4RUZ2_9GAMM|nr:YbhB/YbcL family Raf kinase inhibitor-like protein [Gilvimarinus sp. SDUM040013]MDO3387931.1 YbhB/YbcL family Raf kinase inhibitor-like protein [Gilvimarinus sp. SDUM040013]MDX6848698.1 YbhB/YbcL family Raf kinase inhibitor-like protein [Gilvimarinus sp. SDUM040013]
MNYRQLASAAALCSASLFAQAETFTLTSPDIEHGEPMSKVFEYQGFGCSGDNLSPALQWENPPEGTNFYAIFAYDPDAPTGSGWWHWQVINIPASTTHIVRGAGSIDSEKLPQKARQIRNDYGEHAFGGACPPVGHGPHRYQFTVYALPQALDLPKGASAALTGYMVNANALASSTLETTYER